MYICGVSTSNLIQSLDSYHAAREKGEKAYIIHNGCELEVKTLTLWDRINVFFQKLFGKAKPDSLFEQIRAGSNTIKGVVSIIGINRFDIFDLYEKKRSIMPVIRHHILENLVKTGFSDLNEAYTVAIYLGIQRRPHKVIKSPSGYSYILEKVGDENLFITQQRKLKESLGIDSLENKKCAMLCENMNQDYFGGNRLFKQQQILPSA
ncbi:MAG: hypothetical protein FJZ61_04775 [Chlamydiae bacterium]|nr:hypothetical protein [Chlamydiota bacterium]